MITTSMTNGSMAHQVKPVLRWLTCLLAALAVSTSLVGVAAPATSATPPGPELQTPAAKLAAAVTCTPNISTSSKQAVLLVHGTFSTPRNSFASYMQWLPAAGYPVCTVTIENQALGDAQTNVEYVVAAIRKAYELSGGKIAVLGHSQGALLATYALRFWPDLANKVDDFIGFAGTYTYGTDLGNLVCGTPLTCTKFFAQIRPGSNLLNAIAAAPLPTGPSFTSFTTRTDEVVIPQPKASDLDAPGARRFVLQDLCPSDLSEHIYLPTSRTLLPLTLDALAHRGPADVARAEHTACGMNPGGILAGTLNILATLPATIAAFPKAANPSMTEPPLRCYLTHSCAP